MIAEHARRVHKLLADVERCGAHGYFRVAVIACVAVFGKRGGLRKIFVAVRVQIEQEVNAFFDVARELGGKIIVDGARHGEQYVRDYRRVDFGRGGGKLRQKRFERRVAVIRVFVAHGRRKTARRGEAVKRIRFVERIEQKIVERIRYKFVKRKIDVGFHVASVVGVVDFGRYDYLSRINAAERGFPSAGLPFSVVVSVKDYY